MFIVIEHLRETSYSNMNVNTYVIIDINKHFLSCFDLFFLISTMKFVTLLKKYKAQTHLSHGKQF